MINSCSINNSLTFDGWEELDTTIGMIQTNIDVPVSAIPQKPVVGSGGIDLLTAEQYGLVKLSGATRAAEVKRQKKVDAKRLARQNKKPYKLGRGKVHHKTKQATKTRQYRKKWREQPFSCYITGYGCYNVSKDVWDRYVGYLWTEYNSDDIKLSRIKKAPDGTWYGTRQKPYDIYSFNLIHSKHGIIYNGQDRMIYDMSDGSYDAVQSRYRELSGQVGSEVSEQGEIDRLAAQVE